MKSTTETFMKILPTMLMVEDIKPEEKTNSGIIIPTNIKIEQLKGEVKFVGKGTPDMEMIYEVGDNVAYPPNAGRKVEVEGKEWKLIDIREVLFAY
jgi:co-chaperonin GroES (HSP10)